jgi:hypothetical protein
MVGCLQEASGSHEPCPASFRSWAGGAQPPGTGQAALEIRASAVNPSSAVAANGTIERVIKLSCTAVRQN